LSLYSILYLKSQRTWGSYNKGYAFTYQFKRKLKLRKVTRESLASPLSLLTQTLLISLLFPTAPSHTSIMCPEATFIALTTLTLVLVATDRFEGQDQINTFAGDGMTDRPVDKDVQDCRNAETD